MRHIALLLMFTVSLAASAQDVERVTVTAEKEAARASARAFIDKFASPTGLTGKIARWEEGVCPVTVGLSSKYAAFITSRIRDVARQAGSPVNADTNCRANIEVVFTTAPQQLADGIRKAHPEFLGYVSSAAQLDKLAVVSHPIQAWYTTVTRDLRGNQFFDSPRVAGAGSEIQIPMPCATPCGYMNLSSAIGAESVTGGRIADGDRAALYHVIIVADPTKLTDYEVGTLGDYIAFLGLAQVVSLDTCQSMGSIINLLAPGCAAPPGELTPADRSYLHGIYVMRADGNLQVQKDGIVSAILKDLDQ